MKKCILYGAASIGNLAKGSLEKCGFEVLGYIDKRAFELVFYNGLPVWELEDIPAEYVNSDMIIYISVKNVFEHEKIAIDLMERGFQNIVYKPYNVLLGIGNTEEERLSEIYDKLFEGRFKEEINISELQFHKKTVLHDYGLIHKNDGETVTAYIPIEYIFTNNYKDTPMEKWGNICIAAFFTHIDFFRFLENHEDAEPDAYLQEYCIFTAELQKEISVTDAWKDNVIENRTQIYEQMKEALDLDADFFIRNAAEAEWNNEKKYFNLVSGKHRCTFLAAMGKRYIPIKIRLSDYSKFINYSEVNEIMSLLAKEKKEVSVPHPYFYRGMFNRDRSEWKFFLWFARYYGRKLFYEIGKVDFTKLNIVDYSNDYGYFARFAKRMGCRVLRKKEPEALELQLNRLQYAENIYDSSIINQEHRKSVAVVDAQEIECIDITQYNCAIVKYGTESIIKETAENNQFKIIKLINRRYHKGELLFSYLLEK